jgi:DNA (cytosine-5)-methyltransferase 1
VAAYYNENDPYAAQWLRNLIQAGHIAPGDVDERSIVDVRAEDLRGYTQCHFFAGLGGWSRALRLAGWDDARPVWTGSCPCQPGSAAGKQKGFADERHLWPVWLPLIVERRPAKVFGEQVAAWAEWLGLVRGDLEALGYAVGAMPVEAASAGADHLRDRFWFVADADEPGSQGRRLLSERADQRPAGPDGVANADSRGNENGLRIRLEKREGLSDANGGDGREPDAGRLEWVIGADGKARRVKPGIRLLAHGVPARVAKLRALGNAIDPRPAAAFIAAASEAMNASVIT